MKRNKHTLADVDASIKRWQTRLHRAVTALRKLEAKRKRLEKTRDDRRPDKAADARPAQPGTAAVLAAAAAPAKPTDTADRAQASQGHSKPSGAGSDVSDISWAEMTGANLRTDDEIPTFLRRAGNVSRLTPADQAAIAEITASHDDLAKRKKKGQDAKRKAKAKGELRRMPLTGKAALAAIRGG